jgi:hypothetical protein
MVTQLGLAALFLAVIGGSVGFIIGTTRDQTQTPRRPAALPPAPAVEPTFPVPTSAATPSPAVTATTPPGGELCPEHTQQVAREKAGSPGYLRQVLRVHTARSDVWICRDAAGALFYQGLTSDGTSGVAREFREGVNALFLPGVVRLGTGPRTWSTARPPGTT